jgi:hypothetical protein
MTRLQLSRRLFLAAPFAAALRAADDFWATKPADQWTAEECEKLLSDSPWTKKQTVARGALIEGLGAPAPRGRRGVVITHTVDLVIRWMSAQPMKQALASLVPAKNRKQAKRSVFRDEAGYVLIVKGLPVNVMQLSGESRSSLERSAELRFPGRDPLKVTRFGVARDGAAADLRFVFPEVPNLTIADKSAELRFEMGRAKIKQKFDLDKMLYQGELAL